MLGAAPRSGACNNLKVVVYLLASLDIYIGWNWVMDDGMILGVYKNMFCLKSGYLNGTILGTPVATVRAYGDVSLGTLRRNNACYRHLDRDGDDDDDDDDVSANAFPNASVSPSENVYPVNDASPDCHGGVAYGADVASRLRPVALVNHQA